MTHVHLPSSPAHVHMQVASWEELKGSHSQLGAQLAKAQREKAALISDQERTRMGFEAATVELAQAHATQLHEADRENQGLHSQLHTLRSPASELESRSSLLEARVSSLSEQRAQLEQQSSRWGSGILRDFVTCPALAIWVASLGGGTMVAAAELSDDCPAGPPKCANRWRCLWLAWC